MRYPDKVINYSCNGGESPEDIDPAESRKPTAGKARQRQKRSPDRNRPGWFEGSRREAWTVGRKSEDKESGEAKTIE